MSKTISLFIAAALSTSAFADNDKHDMKHHSGGQMNHADMNHDHGAGHDHGAVRQAADFRHRPIGAGTVAISGLLPWDRVESSHAPACHSFIAAMIFPVFSLRTRREIAVCTTFHPAGKVRRAIGTSNLQTKLDTYRIFESSIITDQIKNL